MNTATEITDVRRIAQFVYPDSTTARVSRDFEVNPRSAQKWMAGQNDAPEHVTDGLAARAALVGNIQAEISAVIANHMSPDVDMSEAIASQLALAYKRLVNREVE